MLGVRTTSADTPAGGTASDDGPPPFGVLGVNLIVGVAMTAETANRPTINSNEDKLPKVIRRLHFLMSGCFITIPYGTFL